MVVNGSVDRLEFTIVTIVFVVALHVNHRQEGIIIYEVQHFLASLFSSLLQQVHPWTVAAES